MIGFTSIVSHDDGVGIVIGLHVALQPPFPHHCLFESAGSHVSIIGEPEGSV